MSPRRLAIPLALLLLAAAAAWRLLVPGVLLLTQLCAPATAAPGDEPPLTVRDLVPEPAGPPVRVYVPARVTARPLLVVHGVHHAGWDEPRLIRFARVLSGLGHVVVTPDIGDLRRYEVSPRAVAQIERAARWLLDEPGLAGGGDGRIGLLGISFAGGLCLSAARAPELRHRLAFVFSFGGHGDLDRTLAYLASGKLPDGGTLPPHVYGQAVLARQLAARLVPAEEVAAVRGVLLDYLREEWETVRGRLDTLGPEARRLVRLCLDRDTDTLGALLAPHLAGSRTPDVLSPERGPPPRCPVFLLHGSQDNVIPPSETAAVARWAGDATPTTALVSDVVVHVELEEEGLPPLLATWRLVRFWTELLRS